MVDVETIVNRCLTQLTLLLVALFWFAPSQAQETETETESGAESDTRRCIPTRSIRRIRIIDDRNVLIYLSARKIFHNVLRNTCSGLKRLGTFSYNSSDGQMCEGDGIAGVTGAWNDVRPVPQCWLGIHHRVSKEQADSMRDASKRGPKIRPKPLPVPEPSDVGSDPEDAGS